VRSARARCSRAGADSRLGRDELGTGEMWNSNSVIATVLARSGIDAGAIQPPSQGRAPGWCAGVVVAHRHDGVGPAASEARGQPAIGA
jgi:hypothetical protein